MSQYRFIVAWVILLSASFVFAGQFEYYEVTINDLQKQMTEKEVSCESITRAYLNRILNYDLALSKGTPINTIQLINKQAIARAKSLDKYYQQHQKLRGLLHCVPVVIKDNISTSKMPMTAGTFALFGNQPTFDATVVRRIEKAGGIILASTTMDELSAGNLGVSSRHGRTGNAYDIEKTAGGSSAGSAVAVSFNFSILGLGTDQAGGSRIPAGFNGVYSLRPTNKLIPQKGIFSQAPLDDLVAPIARTPADLAIFLQVLSGKKYMSYRGHMNNGSLRGKRVGVLQSVNGVDLYQKSSKKALKEYQSFIKRLKGLGAQLILKVQLDQIQSIAFEDTGAVNTMLHAYPSVRKDFKDMCHSGRMSQMKKSENCSTVSELSQEEQDKRNEVIKQNQKLVSLFMKENKLDVLLYPLSSEGVATLKSSQLNPVSIGLASYTGLPAMTLLTGAEQQGLPVAMQMLGHAFDEKTLLAIAYDYDLHFTPRRLPNMLLSANPIFRSNTKFNFYKDALGQYVQEHYLSTHTTDTLDMKVFKNLYRNFIKSRTVKS